MVYIYHNAKFEDVRNFSTSRIGETVMMLSGPLTHITGENPRTSKPDIAEISWFEASLDLIQAV